MEPNPAANLATIATAAGCSVSTVSRALRGSAVLPARTITRIRRVALRLGYRPNPLVTQVMRHMRGAHIASSRGTLAYLVFGPTAGEWQKHLTFVGFFEGARARAVELGFTLEEFWADNPAMSPSRLGQILRARGITGVIVGPAPGLPAAPRLNWADFAPVKIGVPFLDLPLPCAVSNHYRGMLRVIDRLKALGYRRLGLVLQEHQNIKTSALWLAPLAYHEQHLRPGDRVAPLVMKRWREADFARWFRVHRPEVVIGLRSELIDWLGRLGHRVPGDVGFVHLDRCTEPGNYAGIDQKPREVGAAAVDMAVNRLLANERNLQPAPRQLLVEGVWVNGPTVRAVRVPRGKVR
ncbi:MAG: LacI family DNA-binding transcriptional regulator [Lacunisphaera sp.]|nr:LacI family DNA-binding transcriptional regulator [Lacunisphaera sp.]